MSGTVSGPFRNLWLVARVGDQNWPVAEVEPKAGQWAVAEAMVLGLPYRAAFEMLLIDVSDNVRLNLWEALAVGDRVGKYPPVLTRRLGEDLVTVASRRYEASK